ncbi:MAG TPA: phage portal protein, partial [Bacteroidales bacterium]|nr:phage portal protein [Bacteroidales bacterium]
NYIAKNSIPTFYVDWGETQGRTKISKSETSTDSRHIITVGKDGKVQDVTWQGATESVSQRYARIRNAFFEQVQIPDISFATLINSRTSAENKELLFSDVKQKAKDLGTEWETLLTEEIEIVKQFAKVLFPSLTTSIDLITCTCEVVPYSIKTKKETAEYISLAGDNMSLQTKVSLLDEVEDIDAEVERIESGNSAAANQGF